MTTFQWYDNAGRQRQMSKAQVIATVKKYRLPKRKIYGQMAVDSEAWDALMQRLDIPLVPSYRKIALGADGNQRSPK